MKPFAVQLFGPFALHIDAAPVQKYATARGQALLAYLLLNADQPHPREHLAELFWPERSPKQARQNLRQTLSRMRRDLGQPAAAAAGGFEVDYQTVRLSTDPFDVDALRFAALLAECDAHAHSAMERCIPCCQRLQQALDLYRGDLLAGAGVDSPAFEEWLLFQREHYHRQAVTALHALIEHHRQRRAHAAMRRYARQLVRLEPYQETAHEFLIEALALLGERRAALEQYARCVATLAEELGVAPGERLVQLHARIQRAGEAGDPASAVAGVVARDLPAPGEFHHFPHYLVPFFGREAEMAYIAEQMAGPACRLLTVVGPGGMGKTHLIVQAAQHLNPLNYPDGLYFVPLASLDRAEEVARAIAEAVGIPPVEGRTVRQQLLQGLADRQLLLVLDNFEHLLDAAPLLLEILRRAPGVSCLVSSRRPLQVQAEWQLPLAGLAYPPDEGVPDHLDAQALAQNYSAVAFFRDRARRVQPNFEPNENDARAILDICRLAQGMPLAIAMAAAWLSRYDPVAIAGRIGQSLDFFTLPMQDLPDRHQSMRATFAVSWQLLSSSAQQTLARLSVFRGSFTQAAAQTVAGASALDLVQLVTGSLITRTGDGRYHLHELLRQFAAERLAALGQTAHVRGAHSRYYLAQLAAEEHNIHGAAQLQAIQRLRIDLSNLQAAWVAAGVDRQWVSVQQSLRTFERFLLATGMSREGRALVSTMNQCLAADLGLPAETEDAGAADRLSPPERRRLLARLKLLEGVLAHAHAPFEDVLHVIHEGRTLAEEAPDASDLLGEIHLTLSWIYNRQGQRARAESHLYEAQRRLGDSADYTLQSRLYLERSILAGVKGDQVQRRAHLEESVRLAELSGDLAADFLARRYLIHMKFRLGDFSGAGHHLDRLLHNARTLQNLSAEAQALNFYAGYSFSVGDFETMDRYIAQALPLLKEVGDPYHLGIFYIRQGLHALFVDDLDAALDLANQGVRSARAYQNLDMEAVSLTLLGRILTQQGDLASAWQAFSRAFQIFEEHPGSEEIRTTVIGQACILLKRGEAGRALQMIEPYLPSILAGDVGIIVDYGHVYADVYRILRACDDRRAAPLLATAHAVLTRVAATIPTEALRRSFWHNNPSHRLIQTAFLCNPQCHRV